jgi:hypothetical protein
LECGWDKNGNKAITISFVAFMSILQKPLTYLFQQPTFTLTHATVLNSRLFHSSSSLLGGGPRNPEHKLAARLKRRPLKATRPTGKNGPGTHYLSILFSFLCPLTQNCFSRTIE